MLRPQNVVDADDVLVAEAQQDLDFPQRALAVRLVLEGADLLDGDALARRVIQGRTGRRESGRVGGNRAGLMLHAASFTRRRSKPCWMQRSRIYALPSCNVQVFFFFLKNTGTVDVRMP